MTPPDPNSTSGPNDGSWVTPTIVSTPGAAIGCTTAPPIAAPRRACHRGERGAHRGGVGEAERDAADIGLVHERRARRP